jgi:hypothetical protein
MLSCAHWISRMSYYPGSDISSCCLMHTLMCKADVCNIKVLWFHEKLSRILNDVDLRYGGRDDSQVLCFKGDWSHVRTKKDQLPFQPIRCLRFETGLLIKFYELGPR